MAKALTDAARLDYLDAAAEAGCCLNLVNSDSGYYAVSDFGMQPVVQGKPPNNFATTSVVEDRKLWRKTVREALDCYIAANPLRKG